MMNMSFANLVEPPPPEVDGLRGREPGLMLVVNMVSMAPISLKDRRAPPSANQREYNQYRSMNNLFIQNNVALGCF